MGAICFTCLRVDDTLRYMMKNDALILQLLLSPEVNVAHQCFARIQLHLCDKCMRMLDCISVFRNVAVKSVSTQILYWKENMQRNIEHVDIQVKPEIQNDDQLSTEDIKQETILADDEIEDSGEVITSDIKKENVLPKNTDEKALNIEVENDSVPPTFTDINENEHLLDSRLVIQHATSNIDVENDHALPESLPETGIIIKEENAAPNNEENNFNIEEHSQESQKTEMSNIEEENDHGLPESLLESEMIIKEENVLPNDAETICYLEEYAQRSNKPKMCNIDVEVDKPLSPNDSLVGRLLGRMLEISPYFNGGKPESSGLVCEGIGNKSPEPKSDTLQTKKKTPRKVGKKPFRKVRIKKADLKMFREEQKRRKSYRRARHKCGTCLVEFNGAADRASHRAVYHSMKKDYAKCRVCHQTMPPELLKSHDKAHYSIVACVHCDHWAKDVWAIKKHHCKKT